MYGVSIVVSVQMLNRLLNPAKYNYRFIDKVQVKGKKETVSVYEIFDGEPERIRQLKQKSKQDFEDGIYFYHERRFAEAAVKFEQVLFQNPEDKAAQLHLERAYQAQKEVLGM